MSESMSSAYLREGLDEKAEKEEAVPRPEAVGLKSEEAVNAVLEVLRHYPQEHPEMPDDPTKSRAIRQIIEHSGTHALRRALRNNKLNEINFWKGVQQQAVDATGYDKLINDCKPAAHQITIKGAKGSGKSTKAMDLAKRLLAEGVIDKVMTNIRGPDEHPDVEFSEDISRYLEFAKEPGEKLAVFDEFSTSGNAYTGQVDVEQVMSRCINAFRKSEGGSLRTMYVGHENDNDIHPLVKKQSDVVIEAAGKKDEGLIDVVNVYAGWQDYKKGNRDYRVRGLQDIPEDSLWSFESNYFAHLEWDLDAPEKQIDRGQLIDNWEQYQDGGDFTEEEDEQKVKCRGTNSEGEGCGSMTSHKSGYCEWHRDQWDTEGHGIDPRFEDEDE